ncbi:hypothetical protein CKA32_006604 [Geitlerinema sp. FC II]|nr:hypothetical protein CKA32_006604 [Geitlerinema sp. FC II]
MNYWQQPFAPRSVNEKGYLNLVLAQGRWLKHYFNSIQPMILSE